MKLIVGLGNPEEQYAGTRHNLGFEVLDALVHRLNSKNEGSPLEWENSEKFKSLILKSSYTLDAKLSTLILAKPQTSMNNSGLAVSRVAQFYKIPSEDIIVIHDELDLLLGKMKVRLGGGVGGHHGLESILSSLGTDKFIRVRLGIGNTDGFLGEHKRVSFSAEKFVMEGFLEKERSKVKSLTKHAIQAIEIILEKGIDKAQNQFN